MTHRLTRQRQEHLARLLNNAFTVFEEAVRRGMRDRGFEIAPIYLPVVRNVALEGSRIGDIAELAGLSKQTIGPLVRDLARRGILTVEPDPADGRAKVVRFTPHGMAGLKAGLDAIKALERRCARALGPGGLDRLKTDLRTVREVIGIDGEV